MGREGTRSTLPGTEAGLSGRGSGSPTSHRLPEHGHMPGPREQRADVPLPAGAMRPVLNCEAVRHLGGRGCLEPENLPDFTRTGHLCLLRLGGDDTCWRGRCKVHRRWCTHSAWHTAGRRWQLLLSAERQKLNLQEVRQPPTRCTKSSRAAKVNWAFLFLKGIWKADSDSALDSWQQTDIRRTVSRRKDGAPRA